MAKVGAGVRVDKRGAALALTKINGSDWISGTAVLAGGVKIGRKGVRMWEWKVEKGALTTFGIVDSQFNPQAHGVLHETAHGWGIFQKDGNIGKCCSRCLRGGVMLSGV